MLLTLGGLIIIRMRVLEFTPDVPLEAGGGGMMRHITGLAGYLREAGHQVTIVSARVPPGTPLPPGTVRARGLGVLPLIRAADVVHVHGGRMVEVATTALLAWATRTPFLYTPHAYYDRPAPPSPSLAQRGRQWVRIARKTAWDQVIERFLLSHASAAILLSQPWVQYLAERRLPVHRVTVLPSATDSRPVEVTAEHLPGSPAILSVGRLDPVKRIDDVIAALTEPSLRSAQLHIVGRGTERSQLEQVARERHVDDRVRFYGFVPDEEVARLAAGADIYVIASREEGMPVTLIEMLQRGLPVAASDISGHRPLLTDLGLEDRLFPVGDRAALAEAVTHSIAAGLPAGTVEAVGARYSWHATGPRMLALYEAAVA